MTNPEEAGGQNTPDSSDGASPVKVEMRITGDADLMIDLANLANELQRLGIQASFKATKLGSTDAEI